MDKVLLVEDEKIVSDAWKRYIERGDHTVEVCVADSVTKAVKIYEENKGKFRAIIIDGNIPADDTEGSPKVQTLSLLNKIRGTFTGLIVAASGNDSLQERMMLLCDVRCDKPAMPESLAEVLDRIKNA